MSITSSLLKAMGYKVRSEGEKIVIEGCELVKRVAFEGLPAELSGTEKTVRFLLEGKPLSSELLESAKQLLTLNLRSQGYREAEVTFDIRKKPEGYTVTVKVATGPLFYIEKVQVVAPGGFKKTAVEKFKPLKGTPFNLRKLKETVERLEGELLDEGYYNVSVVYSLVPFEEKTAFRLRPGKPVTLFIKLKPGKKYTLVFKGNRHIATEKLTSLVTFRQAKSVDEFELENSKNNILNYYKNNGFPFATVNGTIKEGNSHAEVVFSIDEGERVTIKDVKIAGAKTLPAEASKLIGKPFSLKKIREVATALQKRLQSNGYVDAKVSHAVDAGRLTFFVEKGRRYTLVSVKVQGDSERCYKEVSTPVPFSKETVKNLKESILSCYADKGYDETKVSVEEEVKGGAVNLKVRVEPGKKLPFGYVLVTGLERTRLKWIDKLFVIKPGETYTKGKVVEQYSRLTESRLFSSVTIDEVKTKDCVNEIVKLKEGNRLHAKGFTGYGADSGYVLSGSASSTSPFGFGVRYFLFGDYRQKEGYDAVFKLSKPEFPFKRYETTYSIVKKEQIFQSFKTDRVLYRFSLSRRASKVFTQTYGMEVAREKVKDTSIETNKHFVRRSVFYIQTYDKRNSHSNPTEGYLSRIILSLAGGPLGGNTDYYRIDFKFLYLLTPLWRTTFAFRCGAGFIRSFSGSSVPVQERFYLGGAESVRGYKYGTISPRDSEGNYIGGESYGLLGAEARWHIRKKLQFALFCDSGKVFAKVKNFNINLSDWYTSVGFGFRYITPVGPLRFDYGYKLKDVPGQGPGRVHISFGFPF